jgi:putative flippase GtrA
VVEAAKFAVVGGSGVLVNFLVFNGLLHGPGSPATTATVVAGCVAMGTNYLGFRHFTYRERASRTRRQIALFFVGYHGFGMRGPVGSNAVKAASVMVSSAFRFLVCRTWVFPLDDRAGA